MLVNRVIERYEVCGRLAFSYGQGSTFSGFSAESDVDLVMIWDEAIPEERPLRLLCDADVDEPVRFDGPHYGLDKLVMNGREVDVAHYSRATFDSWCAAVGAGDGWQEHAWPLPLHAVAGFVYGTQLADPRGAGAGILDSIRTPPVELHRKARSLVVEELPVYRDDLARCAERGDGWLFERLAGGLMKHAYVTWFAAENCYLPFPKHLHRWIDRLGLDADLARHHSEVWEQTRLSERQRAMVDFVERVAALKPTLN